MSKEIKLTKRFKEIYSKVDKTKSYKVEEAIDLLKQVSKVKFDETVEIVFFLNVDPRKSEQMIRGVVSLPHGTGKSVRILVFGNAAKEKEALEAGADFVGFNDYIEKVKKGWVDFDVLVVTPDMMKEVGKLGKVLGPKGLMPSPKSGTVTNDIGSTVKEIKKGKIEYRVDKFGNISVGVGKISFDKNNLIENAKALIEAVIKSRPSTVKGEFVKNLSISSTMGPGIKIDLGSIISSEN